MSGSSTSLATFGVLIALCTCCTPTELKQEGDRKDNYGDSVPPGARMRLGTVRWRLGFQVLSIAVSPSAEYAVTGSADGKLRWWKPRDGSEWFHVLAHNGHVTAACYTPDGKRLVSGGWDGKTRVWDSLTGALLLEAPSQKKPILAVAVSPNSRYLAVASEDSTIWIYSLDDTKVIGSLKGADGGSWRLAFSPDSKILASSGGDRRIRLWELSNLREMGELEEEDHGTMSLSFSRDGRLLATTRLDGSIHVWDLITRKSHRVADKAVLTTPASGLSFLKNDESIVAAGFGGLVAQWNVSDGRLTNKVQGHYADVTSLIVAPNEQLVCTASLDSTLGVWELPSWNRIINPAGHESSVTGVRFVASDKKIVSSDRNGQLRIWRGDTGAELEVLDTRSKEIQSLAVNSDGNLLAWSDGLRKLHVWSLGERKELLPLENFSVVLLFSRPVALSPDGKKLASVDQDGALTLWEPRSGARLWTAKDREHKPRAIAFSASGDELVSAAEDGTVQQVRFAPRNEVSIRESKVQTQAIALSRDGRLLALAGRNEIRVFDTVSWDLKAQLAVCQTTTASSAPAHPNDLVLSLSPDGRWLAYSNDDVVRLHDLAGRKQVRELKGHKGVVTSLDFSIDGTTLLSGSSDTTVLAWSVME